MHTLTYQTHGVCSRAIDITLDDSHVIREVTFHGGCSGNTQGVAALCIGRPVDEVIKTIKGIKCGVKSTSCPDQLALALEQAVAEEAK